MVPVGVPPPPGYYHPHGAPPGVVYPLHPGAGYPNTTHAHHPPPPHGGGGVPIAYTAPGGATVPGDQGVVMPPGAQGSPPVNVNGEVPGVGVGGVPVPVMPVPFGAHDPVALRTSSALTV